MHGKPQEVSMDETPVEDVLRMMNSGMNDADIIRRLTDEGFSPVQISDALNQAKIKQEIAPSGVQAQQPQPMQPMTPPPMPPVPRPVSAVPKPVAVVPQPQPMPSKSSKLEEQAYPYPYSYPSYPSYPQEAQQQKVDTDTIEEIAEEIVNEKWLEVKNRISDVIEWKVYAEKRIDSIDERLKRIEMSFDRLQASLLSKVQEYGRDVKDLGSEVTSLGGAFGKILNPLVENVKELSRITEDLKGKTPSAKKSVKK